MQKLADQGAPVKEIMWIKKKIQNRENTESEIIATNTLRLEFVDEAPKEVFLSYLRYEVFDYIQDVTQCFKCQGFGHVAKHCHSGTSTCVQCGYKGHRKSDKQCRPPGNIRCANCYGPHKAWSKTCPYYLKEVEALKIRGRTKSTIHLARNLAEESFPTLNSRTENLEKQQQAKGKSYADATNPQAKPKSDAKKKRYTKNKNTTKPQKTKNNQIPSNNDIGKIIKETISSILPQILLPIVKIMVEVFAIPGEITGKITRVTEVVQETIDKLSLEQNTLVNGDFECSDSEDEDYNPNDSVQETSTDSGTEPEEDHSEDEATHSHIGKIIQSNILPLQTRSGINRVTNQFQRNNDSNTH